MNEAEAIAALVAAGVPIQLAGALVAHWQQLKQAHLMDVFGAHLPRDKALVLREKVAAVKEQFVKKLLPQQAAIQTLASFGIPNDNIQALISEWAAQVYKQVLPA